MTRGCMRNILGIAVILAALGLIYAVPDFWPDNGSMEDAIIQGDITRLRTYIRRGGDPNARSRIWWELRQWIHIRRHQFSFSDGEPLLIVAITKFRPEMAQLLLERGANPNVTTEDGETALSRAAGAGYAELVRTLLAKGADPKIRNQDGTTALCDGSRQRDWSAEIVAMLKAAGADPCR